MENTILSGALLISTFLSPTPTPTEDYIKPFTLEVANIYEVKEGDSISSIAEETYGSKDYWTYIWNENESIENPNLIEKGMKLKLKTEKPEKAPEIKPELKTKIPTPKKQILATNTQTQSQTQTQTQTMQITASPSSLNEAQIQFLGQCESGMTPDRNSGNGYYGAFQFSIGTWNRMNTGYERADLAPLNVQIEAVQRLLSRSSIFTQFPGCARKMQSLGLL